jgi:hypothetical protein
VRFLLSSTVAICVFTSLGCKAKTPVPKEFGTCIASGQAFSFPIQGPQETNFRTQFDGYGCVSLAEIGDDRAIHIRPKPASSPNETHACLVLGPQFPGDLRFGMSLHTAKQLRSGSKPNPHEVGWLVWDYQGNDHFYYFLVKPNGWELGKRDPAYPGGQRFLATDASYGFPIGEQHQLEIRQTGPTIEALVDGKSVVRFVDQERPYYGRAIGLYCEDADVYAEMILAESLSQRN